MRITELRPAIEWVKKNPYVLLVLAIGLVLILLPTGDKEPSQAAAVSQEDITVPYFSLAKEEERLCRLLESISGVGKTEVLLSLGSTARRNIAESSGEAIVVSVGSGKQKVVENGYDYPEYLGAVIVCQGADSASVRLSVTNAVSAFTGLGSGKIIVLKTD